MGPTKRSSMRWTPTLLKGGQDAHKVVGQITTGDVSLDQVEKDEALHHNVAPKTRPHACPAEDDYCWGDYSRSK